MKGNSKSSMWVTSDTSTTTNSCVCPTFNDSKKATETHGNLVYGLQGLADFLHQSVTTAWRLKKSGKFDAAISQKGRCIITDTDKLLELMRLDHVYMQSE